MDKILFRIHLSYQYHILSITFDDKQYFVLIIKQETSRGIGPSLDKGWVSHPKRCDIIHISFRGISIWLLLLT